MEFVHSGWERQPLFRRQFISRATLAASGVVLGSSVGLRRSRAAATLPAHRPMRALYDSLSREQREVICFDWDYRCDIKYGRKPLTIPDPKGIILRAHVSNAWLITPPRLGSDFYTPAQRDLVRDILETTMNDGWTDKLMRQAEDDSGMPWGGDQAVAFFGAPGTDRFQCSVTGFHLSVRGGGQGSPHAFGGAIAHGHQPSGFYERVGHPGNFFWHQALEANKVFQMLDTKQRERSLVDVAPFFVVDGQIDRTLVTPDGPNDGKAREADIRFRGPGGAFPGLPIAEMNSPQQAAVERLLNSLIDPYRPIYQAQVKECLRRQGGLRACSLAFYRDGDLGDDGEWDNWRLEGPSFVWYFRGAPHTHIYINVADTPRAPVSAYFG